VSYPNASPSVPPGPPESSAAGDGSYPPPFPAGAPGSFPVPGPPPAKRTGLKIGLSILAAVVALCVGGAVIAVVKNMATPEGYPATLSAPDQVAGLTKQTDADLQKNAEELASSLKDQTKATTAVAAYYAKEGDDTHLVAFWGATAKLRNAGAELDAAFKGATESTALSDIHAVPVGSLGGQVKCGSGEMQQVPIALCIWADGGSMGAALFFNRTVDESAPLFISIREGVTHRG